MIALVLFIVPFVIARPVILILKKCPAYECGFNPFDDARMKFDVQLLPRCNSLFIIFDLEVVFIYFLGPWRLKRTGAILHFGP